MGWALVILFVTGGIALLWAAAERAETVVETRADLLRKAFARKEGFKVSQRLFSAHNRSAIAIDEAARMIAFATLNEHNFSAVHRYSYREIIGAEIVEDGAAIESTSRS